MIGERLKHLLGLIPCHRLAIRASTRGRLKRHVVEAQGADFAGGADAIDPHVAEDRQDPRPDVRSQAELIERLERAQERFLRQIIRLGNVAGQNLRRPQHHVA